MYKIFLYSLLSLTFFNASLSAKFEEKSSNIRMKVGSIRISDHVYERELIKVKSRMRPDQFNEEIWRNEWADKLKIVCEAKSLGYADDSDLKKSVDVLSAYMLTQSIDGPYAAHILSKSNETTLSKRENRKLLTRLFAEEKNHILLDAKKVEVSENMTYFVDNLATAAHPIRLESLDDHSRTLFRYSHNESKIEITIGEFIEYYNRKIISKSLQGLESLSEEFDELIVNRYRHENAIQLGIDQDLHFIQERENFSNNTLYNIYVSKVIRPVVVPTKKEVSEYYSKESHFFEVPKEIEVSTISSSSRRGIHEFRNQVLRSLKLGVELNMGDLGDSLSVTDMTIRIEEDNYKENERLGLFQISDGNMTRIEESESGMFNCYLLKQRVGHYIPPLSLIQSKVEAHLTDLKQSEAIDALNDDIKEKYKFITYSKNG